MKLRKSRVNPIYWMVDDTTTSVRIQVGGTEAEHSGAIRSRIQSQIVKAVNKVDKVDKMEEVIREMIAEADMWIPPREDYPHLDDENFEVFERLLSMLKEAVE